MIMTCPADDVGVTAIDREALSIVKQAKEDHCYYEAINEENMRRSIIVMKNGHVYATGYHPETFAKRYKLKDDEEFNARGRKKTSKPAAEKSPVSKPTGYQFKNAITQE